MERKNITYNQLLGKEIGFSRAVRIGNIIAITATAPIAKDGSVYNPNDMYGQAKRCLQRTEFSKFDEFTETIIKPRLRLEGNNAVITFNWIDHYSPDLYVASKE